MDDPKTIFGLNVLPFLLVDRVSNTISRDSKR